MKHLAPWTQRAGSGFLQSILPLVFWIREASKWFPECGHQIEEKNSLVLGSLSPFFSGSASKRFPNNKSEVSKWQVCSFGASAIFYKSHSFGSQGKQKARMEELDPNLPLKREMWLGILMAGPSSALDLPLVLCPAGISVLCDGVLLIHLFSFIFWSKLTAILAVSWYICNIYFEKEKGLRRLPRCPAVIILPAL